MRELTFDANSRLEHVWNPQRRIDAIADMRIVAVQKGERGKIRDRQIEVRIPDHVLSLVDSVQKSCLHQERRREPIVKDAWLARITVFGFRPPLSDTFGLIRQSS